MPGSIENIISQRDITPQAITRAITTFLEFLPEDRKWLDFFAGSTGRTIQEILTAFSVFLAYKARIARRESTLATARLESSIRSIAYTLGYPMARRKAARLNLLFDTSGEVVSDTALLGKLGSLSVSTLDGEPLDKSMASGDILEVVVGDWVEVGPLPIPEDEFGEIEFVPKNSDGVEIGVDAVDNDLVKVFLHEGGLTQGVSDNEIETGFFAENLKLSGATFGDVGGDLDALLGMLPSVLVVTFGGVVGQGVTFGRKPPENSTARVRYLVVPDASSVDYTFSLWDPSGLTIGGSTMTREDFVDPASDEGRPLVKSRQFPADDAAKVARLVPGYFSAKRRMITPVDHEAVVLSKNEIYDCKVVRNECSIDPHTLGTRGDCENPVYEELVSVPEDASETQFAESFSNSSTADARTFLLTRTPPADFNMNKTYLFGFNSTSMDEDAKTSVSDVTDEGDWYLEGSQLTVWMPENSSIHVHYDITIHNTELRRKSFRGNRQETDLRRPDVLTIVRRNTDVAASDAGVPVTMRPVEGLPSQIDEYGTRVQYDDEDDTNTEDNGKPLIYFHALAALDAVEIQYNAEPGVWTKAKRPSDDEELEGCQTLISYIRSDNDDEDRPEPSSSALSVTELADLEKSLEIHQILGEELIFRNAVAIGLEVRLRVLPTAGARIEDLQPQIDELVEKQCWRLGGLFVPAVLIQEINGLDDVVACDIVWPRRTRKTSNLGYFTPPENGADIQLVSDMAELLGFTDR